MTLLSCWLDFTFCLQISLAVINWLNKQMNEQMIGRGPLVAHGFPRTSTHPAGMHAAPSSSTLSSIRPSPSGVTLPHPVHHLPTGTAGLLGVPHTQLQHRVMMLEYYFVLGRLFYCDHLSTYMGLLCIHTVWLENLAVLAIFLPTAKLKNFFLACIYIYI